MTELTEEHKQIIAEEEGLWKDSYEQIVAAIKKTHAEWYEDEQLARDLTSQIVAMTRDEDKASLASDEAVAHGLSKLRGNKSLGLESLVEQPYFARVVTDEEDRQIEFRLSTASFPECRIIDWRKAPISKLYYDYAQGDDFAETIQGRDREGWIKIRRSFQGRRDELNVIELPECTLKKNDQGQWIVADSNEVFSRNTGQSGNLPPILSLITADQFELITKEKDKPLVIQGVAGSGKTTVALHRLAWMLHEDNSDCQAEKCFVLLQSRALKAYISTTLPELNIHGVQINTYDQWVSGILDDLVGPRRHSSYLKPPSLEKFKSSHRMLDLVKEYVSQSDKEIEMKELLNDYYQLLNFCGRKSLSYENTDNLQSYFKDQFENKKLDAQDDSLIMYLLYQRKGFCPHHLGEFDHLVIDEAQDFGLLEIEVMMNALSDERTVTIVGDLAQKINRDRDFESWERVLEDVGFKETLPISMNVSHRTTQEILDVAWEVRKGAHYEVVELKGVRHGPSPSFIRARTNQEVPDYIARWISDRLEESRFTLCGIICRNQESARRLFKVLRKMELSSVRLGFGENFDFSPGIVITDVTEVKGLEFRSLLIVEPSEQNYHAQDEESRNLFYVAVTRAEYRLDFVGAQNKTNLLPSLPRYQFKEER